MTDPVLELRNGGEREERGEGGFVLLALLAFLPSVISSFLIQNKGAPQGPPLDPPLVNAFNNYW